MTLSRAPRPAYRKMIFLWALIALLTPGLRLINFALAPAAAVSAGSDLPDLETVFADAPRYHAYAQAILGRPYVPRAMLPQIFPHALATALVAPLVYRLAAKTNAIAAGFLGRAEPDPRRVEAKLAPSARRLDRDGRTP